MHAPHPVLSSIVPEFQIACTCGPPCVQKLSASALQVSQGHATNAADAASKGSIHHLPAQTICLKDLHGSTGDCEKLQYATLMSLHTNPQSLMPHASIWGSPDTRMAGQTQR